MKKKHEQLINCSSTYSDNISRGLHEKTMADLEGAAESIPPGAGPGFPVGGGANPPGGTNI